MRWGLIPWFGKGSPPNYSTINATVEKLEQGAAWRGPWSRAQRCIMPAAAFYEWHLGEDGKKNPFLIKLALTGLSSDFGGRLANTLNLDKFKED